MKPHHIVEFRAENVKRIRAVTIKPDGSLVVVGGGNAQGKSSVLHAIAYALGGKDAMGPEPLRRGEEDGRVVLRMDDGTVIRRRFFPDGRTDLEIKDESGQPVTGPQTLLNRITGPISFDPLAFKELDRGKKLATVQKLVGLTFDEEDRQAEQLFNERRDVKRDAERARHEAEAMPRFPECDEFDGLLDFMPITELELQLSSATAVNNAASELHAAMLRAESDEASARTLLNDLGRQRDDLKRQLAVIEDRIVKGEEVVRARQSAKCEAVMRYESAQRIDVSTLSTQLSNHREFNRRLQATRDRTAALKRAQDLFDRAEGMTRALDHLAKDKERKIRDAKFPVPGMAFTRDGVTLNGLPFEEASDAEQLRASVLIGAALNPALRVMLVHNGEKLDPQGLHLLASVAEDHDLQIWLERVSTGPECSVIIEDGTVKA